jgi:MFS family permease
LVVWSTAAAALFFARAFLFSTWVSRGPEVQIALNLNNAQMGLFTMLYAVGGLVGIFFASYLVKRFGSKAVAIVGYLIGSLALIGIGFGIDQGALLLSSLLLFSIGLPMAIEDFVGNYEGNAADRVAKRSIFPAIHGAYGLGMLGGAGFSSIAIGAGISLTNHYLITGILAGAVSIAAGLLLPKHAAENQSGEKPKAGKVWSEPRSLFIAVIGFSFIMAEMSAGTWVPIALTQSGYSGSEAAGLFGMFWVIITLGRLLGGFVVDKIGRVLTVRYSAILASVGILIFIANDLLQVPAIGLVLWGLGIAMGFPMSVAAMGDEKSMAPSRINMIITVVYISSITVGPALGALGDVTGLFVAFAIPLVMMITAAALSSKTKQIDS